MAFPFFGGADPRIPGSSQFSPGGLFGGNNFGKIAGLPGNEGLGGLFSSGFSANEQGQAGVQTRFGFLPQFALQPFLNQLGQKGSLSLAEFVSLANTTDPRFAQYQRNVLFGLGPPKGGLLGVQPPVGAGKYREFFDKLGLSPAAAINESATSSAPAPQAQTPTQSVTPSLLGPGTAELGFEGIPRPVVPSLTPPPVAPTFKGVPSPVQTGRAFNIAQRFTGPLVNAGIPGLATSRGRVARR